MKKGVLIINLGTPESPSVKNVRKYLREFLMDKRVIDIPAIFRFLLVWGIIIPTRSRNSARLYWQIWNKKTGSPLMHYSVLQKQLLQIELDDGYQVELAMRYQYPSIRLALDRLKQSRVNSIDIIPLFPQYASATSGSVISKVMAELAKWDNIPEIKISNSFYNNKLIIKAFAENGQKHAPENYDHILFSFHGLPQRQLHKCDPTKTHCLQAKCCETLTSINKICYGAQCHATARLIAEQLNIPKEKYTVSFQSRLGKTPWIEPYTSAVISKLAQSGIKRLLVFCPAFVADCLETLYEISIEYRDEFIAQGGDHLQLVESLNDSPLFINALKGMIILPASHKVQLPKHLKHDKGKLLYS